MVLPFFNFNVSARPDEDTKHRPIDRIPYTNLFNTTLLLQLKTELLEIGCPARIKGFPELLRFSTD